MKIDVSKYLLLLLLPFFISCTSDSQVSIKQVLDVGMFKIVVFEKNIGATSDYSMNVSIIEKDKKITNKDKGNVFISKGLKNISLSIENNNIVVSHSYLDTDIFYKTDFCYGYNFIYEIKK